MARKAAPKTPRFQPFADDAAVVSFGGFTIENGAGRIVLHGALDLTRDRQGLERAKRLKALLDGIVAALESEDLPERVVEQVQEPTRVKNPFA